PLVTSQYVDEQLRGGLVGRHAPTVRLIAALSPRPNADDPVDILPPLEKRRTAFRDGARTAPILVEGQLDLELVLPADDLACVHPLDQGVQLLAEPENEQVRKAP